MKKIITILILTITVTNIYSQKIDYTKSYSTVYDQLMKAQMYEKCISYFDSLVIDEQNETDELDWGFSSIKDYYNYRSNAKEKLGDYVGSIEDNLKSFPSKDDMYYSKERAIERYVYIANIYLKSNTPEKAISMFDKKLVDTIDINLEKAKIEFVNKRWNDYLSYKDNNKSIEVLDSLIKDSPNNFILLADRGLCYFYNGEFQKSLTDLNKSISINCQNYVWSYVFRAETKKMLNHSNYKDDLNKALDICDKSIQINKNSENYLTRAIVYAILEQYDKAMTDCDNEHNNHKNDYNTVFAKYLICQINNNPLKKQYDAKRLITEKQSSLLLVELNLIYDILTIAAKKRSVKLSIVVIGKTKENFLMQGQRTEEIRKDIINDIAYVNLYQHLLKDEADYTEKITKHYENVAYLKRELNITEQEIQEEINKLENE